jgi:hypothetical protein
MRLVVPVSLLIQIINEEAVTVARGIAHRRVRIAPFTPAVQSKTVLVGASPVIVPATPVATAEAVLGVCANAAVKVLAMI